MNLDKKIEESLKKLLKKKKRKGENVLKGSKFEKAMKGFEKADADLKRDYPEVLTMRRRRTPAQNASTEYEGHTLSEKIEFIKTFLSEGKKTGTKNPKPKNPEPKWPFPPTKEAVDRLKKIRAAREAKQVESRSIEDQHAEYKRSALKAGRTPGKPHPMHGEHFPEDPPKENLTPAQQKRRNKQIKRSKLF